LSHQFFAIAGARSGPVAAGFKPALQLIFPAGPKSVGEALVIELGAGLELASRADKPAPP